MYKFLLFAIFTTCLCGNAFGKSLVIPSDDGNSDDYFTAQDLYISQDVLASSNNLYDCINESTNKTLLYSTTFNKNAAFLGWVTHTLTYPSNGLNTKLITCIMANDNSGDGSGGFPTVTSGGVNSYSVELTFTSQFNRGLHYTVRIYADAV